MSIPTFQQFFLPLLQCLADGRERRIQDCADGFANVLELSEADRNQLLESGRQTIFDNRSHWAATYLGKAGLIVLPKRGMRQITERGLAAIRDADSGAVINNAYLRRFPEFVAFETKNHNESEEKNNDHPKPDNAEKTPLESIEAGYQSLHAALASDLLERIKGGSPRFFEQLVLDLLVAMGYGGSRLDAAEAVGRSGDEGVDGIIKEDKLGLDSIYLQAKRWESPVGRPVVQGFAGSLEGHRARKGVFITTSKFSQDAHEYVRRIEKKIVLIDGQQLSSLMVEHGVGVTDVAIYHIKRIDEDYFEES